MTKTFFVALACEVCVKIDAPDEEVAEMEARAKLDHLFNNWKVPATYGSIETTHIEESDNVQSDPDETPSNV